MGEMFIHPLRQSLTSQNLCHSSFNSMDPYNEQRLRDEVIYLHSLWHQGTPRPAASAVQPYLQPLKTTQFKKQKRTNPNSESNSSSSAEWPCPAASSPPSTTAWPVAKPNSPPLAWPCWSTPQLKPYSSPPPLSTEDQLKLGAKHAHRNAVNTVRKFLLTNNDDDSDAIDSSSDEDDELVEEDCGQDVECSFFFKVFEDDTELREYYEKNFAKGEFSCLICGAIGGKGTTKKYKGCLSLVQHSITIAKTKKRRAHRALGQAVCKVLGWDIHNLSAIVSMLSDKLGDASGSGSVDNKESSMTLLDNVDSAVPESVYIQPESSCNGGGEDVNSITCPDATKDQTLGILNQHEVEQPATEELTTNSLTSTDADRNLENLGVVDRHNTEDTATEWLRNVPRNNNSGIGDEVEQKD